MEARKIVRSVSLVALLVLGLSVTGTFADGVASSHSVVAVASTQTLNLNNGVRNNYSFPTSLATLFPAALPNAIIAIIPNPPPPTTPTPEPSAVYLFMLGAAMMLFALRRRAAQS